MQINRDLIELIEEYAGSMEALSDIENISLYHNLSIGKSIDLPTLPYPKIRNIHESTEVILSPGM